MKVYHYLFWIKDNKIAAINNKGNSYEVMKFKGNTSIAYKENFWDEWLDYAGFTKDDLTDFCFIYDKEMPCVSEYLKEKECDISDCIWNRYTINNIVKSIELPYTAKIFDENDNPVASGGSFRNIKDEDIIKLKVSYRCSNDESEPEKEDEPYETTPFIDDMLKKLHLYDEEE